MFINVQYYLRTISGDDRACSGAMKNYAIAIQNGCELAFIDPSHDFTEYLDPKDVVSTWLDRLGDLINPC